MSVPASLVVFSFKESLLICYLETKRKSENNIQTGMFHICTHSKVLHKVQYIITYQVFHNLSFHLVKVIHWTPDVEKNLPLVTFLSINLL